MIFSFTLKSIFLIFLIIILKPPLNNYIDLIFFSLGIFVVFCFETKIKSKINNYLITFIFFLILILNFFTNTNSIKEIHSTFFSNKDIETISKILPKNIINKILIDYEKFDLSRALKSHDGSEFQSEENFNNFSFIEIPNKFSADNFFYDKAYTKSINNINFSNREELRISQINNLKYNLVFDKEFRREIPYFVIFDIPKKYKNSKICGYGNIFYSYNFKDINDLQDATFKIKKSNCLVFDNDKDLKILGYSINKDKDLSIKLNKNFINILLDTLKYYLASFIILIFIFNFFSLKRFSNKEIIIITTSVLSSILFILLKDHNMLFGLRYFRGGADGLVYENHAVLMLYYLKNFNILEFLRGQENIYYFMPGLRYFLAITKIIFGDTSYGYLILSFVIPISLFYFFKNIISEKIAFYLIISFTLLPIFENMGFGHYNYIHQIVRNHAETLSISIIIFCFAKFTNPNFEDNINYLKVFFYCLILAIATFCRPNFFPTTSIIFIYLFFITLKRSYMLSASAVLGFSFVFVSLIHNYYFGNDISLFTKSDIHFVFNDAFANLNLQKIENDFVINQFIKWNPIYNIHRLFILIFIVYCFFRFEKNNINILLFSSTFSQHIVLLLTHPDSRYAYLAWLLTFILFVNYLFNFYLKKLK